MSSDSAITRVLRQQLIDRTAEDVHRGRRIKKNSTYDSLIGDVVTAIKSSTPEAATARLYLAHATMAGRFNKSGAFTTFNDLHLVRWGKDNISTNGVRLVVGLFHACIQTLDDKARRNAQLVAIAGIEDPAALIGSLLGFLSGLLTDMGAVVVPSLVAHVRWILCQQDLASLRDMLLLCDGAVPWRDRSKGRTKRRRPVDIGIGTTTAQPSLPKRGRSNDSAMSECSVHTFDSACEASAELAPMDLGEDAIDALLAALDAPGPVADTADVGAQCIAFPSRASDSSFCDLLLLDNDATAFSGPGGLGDEYGEAAPPFCTFGQGLDDLLDLDLLDEQMV